jgi:hypothetical protein
MVPAMACWARAGSPDMAKFFGISGPDEVDELGRRFGRG